MELPAVRLAPKNFRLRRPDGNGGWLWNLDGIEPVLYRLPEVLKAKQAGGVIYIVEGEKCVETVRSLGLAATCNPMGAGKWQKCYSEWLRDAHCVILPDHDEAGQKHAMQVAHGLYGIAASIRIVTLPELPPKGDVYGWVQAGGAQEQLEALVQATAVWTPPAEGQEGLTLTRLGDLLAEPEEHAEWLVDQLLPAGGIALLVGCQAPGRKNHPGP